MVDVLLLVGSENSLIVLVDDVVLGIIFPRFELLPEISFVESLTVGSLLILSVDYPSDDPPVTVVTERDDLHMVIRVIEVIFLKLFVNSFFDTGDSVVVPRLCVEAVEFPGLLKTNTRDSPIL